MSPALTAAVAAASASLPGNGGGGGGFVSSGAAKKIKMDGVGGAEESASYIMAKQADAIERLKDLARKAGADPTAIAEAAKVL